MRTSTTPISSGTKIQISDKKNLDNTPKLMRKNSKAGISVASPNLGSKEIRRNSIASGRQNSSRTSTSRSINTFNDSVQGQNPEKLKKFNQEMEAKERERAAKKASIQQKHQEMKALKAQM